MRNEVICGGCEKLHIFHPQMIEKKCDNCGSPVRRKLKRRRPRS